MESPSDVSDVKILPLHSASENFSDDLGEKGFRWRVYPQIRGSLGCSPLLNCCNIIIKRDYVAWVLVGGVFCWSAWQAVRLSLLINIMIRREQEIELLPQGPSDSEGKRTETPKTPSAPVYEPPKQVFYGQALTVAFLAGTANFLNGFLEHQNFAVTCMYFIGFMVLSLAYKVYNVISAP